MKLAELKVRQTELVMQRAQANDIVKQSELGLGQINFAIQVIEANAKADIDAIAASAEAAQHQD